MNEIGWAHLIFVNPFKSERAEHPQSVAGTLLCFEMKRAKRRPTISYTATCMNI